MHSERKPGTVRSTVYDPACDLLMDKSSVRWAVCFICALVLPNQVTKSHQRYGIPQSTARRMASPEPARAQAETSRPAPRPTAEVAKPSRPAPRRLPAAAVASAPKVTNPWSLLASGEGDDGSSRASENADPASGPERQPSPSQIFPQAEATAASTLDMRFPQGPHEAIAASMSNQEKAPMQHGVPAYEPAPALNQQQHACMAPVLCPITQVGQMRLPLQRSST